MVGFVILIGIAAGMAILAAEKFFAEKFLWDCPRREKMWERALLAVLPPLLFILAYERMGWSAALGPVFMFIFLLALTGYLDYQYGFVLRPLLVALAAILPLELFFGGMSGAGLGERLGACLAGGGLFWLLAKKTGGIGFGDAPLIGVLGLWLGSAGLAFTLFLAVCGAAAAALFLLAIGRKRRRDSLPFAPFLSLGAIIVYFYQADLLRWYLEALR